MTHMVAATGARAASRSTERISPIFEINSSQPSTTNEGPTFEQNVAVENSEIGSEIEAASAQGETTHLLEEDKIEYDLRFFFMNPIEKFRARRQFPWKLFIQVVKIFIVTAQVKYFMLI